MQSQVTPNEDLCFMIFNSQITLCVKTLTDFLINLINPLKKDGG